MQKILAKVAMESEKKGIAINCKNTHCMIVNKRDIPRYELQRGDAKIKQIENFNY